MICFLEYSYERDSQLLTRLDKGRLAVVAGLCVLSGTLCAHTALFHTQKKNTCKVIPAAAPTHSHTPSNLLSDLYTRSYCLRYPNFLSLCPAL